MEGSLLAAIKKQHTSSRVGKRVRVVKHSRTVMSANRDTGRKPSFSGSQGSRIYVVGLMYALRLRDNVHRCETFGLSFLNKSVQIL